MTSEPTYNLLINVRLPDGITFAMMTETDSLFAEENLDILSQLIVSTPECPTTMYVHAPNSFTQRVDLEFTLH